MTQYHLIAANRPAAPGGVGEVGNKAWKLMQMAEAGLPVPPAFVLPTTLCCDVERMGSAELSALLDRGMRELEGLADAGFGAARNPLLVSVRSGAAVSMPGMMETVLNVGLNEDTVDALIRATGNPRLAWDCFRRLVESYAEVVDKLPTTPFDNAVAEVLETARVAQARDLDFDGMRALTRAHLNIYREVSGTAFPRDARVQLEMAVRSVFRSWNAEKAVVYRRLNGLDGLAGTAVTVQRMVYGNMGAFSGSGVAFTRDPSDGKDQLYFDFAANAQGEDVVAGRERVGGAEELGRVLPQVLDELRSVRARLEDCFRDAQDFEFTVEDGRLWLLQTRDAKRTSWAALKIAVDMVAQQLITPRIALERLAGIDLDALKRWVLSPAASAGILARGVPASPGICAGRAAFGTTAAAGFSADGEPVILLRPDTSTADIEAMNIASGILTAAGGRTSHAAVVARQLDKVCVVGCLDLAVDERGKTAMVGAAQVREGDWLTVDGNTGAVYAGRVEVCAERPVELLTIVERWKADAARLPGVAVSA